MKPFYPVDMRWPITQKFGVNVEAYPRRNGHPGIDLGTPTGCKLFAVCDGTITAAAYRKAGGYGRDDPQRGNSSGPHLHFEVRDLTQPQTYPLIGAVDPV